MFQFFKSEWFNFETVRTVSYIPFGGADVAECLEALGKIKDKDTESWFRAWSLAGLTAEELAEEAEEVGNHAATRSAYLRASNYFRAAQYMLNSRPGHEDSRVLPTLERAMSNFHRGVQISDCKMFQLDIPYEGDIKLPGYLYLPHVSKRLPGKLPVIINCGGGDSTQEELYFVNVLPALENGYAILTFEGPGQGIVLRRHPEIPLRHDFEVVTGLVLDYLSTFAEQNPELMLDFNRIAILGASVGGYYALRAAADPRFKACISVDPFYSMVDLLRGRVPDFFLDTYQADYLLTKRNFDILIRFLMWADFQMRWEVNHLFWIFNLTSPYDVLRRMEQYTLKNADASEYLHTVKCPVMVTGAASSIYAKPERSTVRIYDTLTQLSTSEKHMWIANDIGTGGLQAKVGAFSLAGMRMFAWLDKQFGIERKKISAWKPE